MAKNSTLHTGTKPYNKLRLKEFGTTNFPKAVTYEVYTVIGTNFVCVYFWVFIIYRCHFSLVTLYYNITPNEVIHLLGVLSS
jgi:hypothetical protein